MVILEIGSGMMDDSSLLAQTDVPPLAPCPGPPTPTPIGRRLRMSGTAPLAPHPERRRADMATSLVRGVDMCIDTAIISEAFSEMKQQMRRKGHKLNERKEGC